MSEERSNLLSLRSGKRRKSVRPVISAPKQISSPIVHDDVGSGAPIPPLPESRAGAGNGPRPRPRPPPAPGGKTSEMVKRRYSSRFGQEYDASGLTPAVPAMPSLDKFDQHHHHPGNRPAGGAPVVDVKAIRDPNLVPDQYVTSVLSEATDEQILEYENGLHKLKIRARTDLQQNLLQNRTQFIKISKEAEKLKNEMHALRNLMAELKTNTRALRVTSNQGDESSDLPGGVPSGLSKRDKRSSVADRSALWNSQMQALFKSVEGSQKFLPNVTGRHIVQNAGPWVELDNATYKSRRAMQIFLLNDHLLIASRKKRKVDVSHGDTRNAITKLVADRCWALLDIEVVDMAGTGESHGGRNKLADAIMVRGGGQESFIYRTEKPEDPEKKSFLLNVRKAVEELRKGLQSEMEASNKARETINYFASRDPGLLQKTELLATLSDIKDMLIEVDGKQQNLRWVESQMDELDIDIALQRFESAVSTFEKLKGLARGLKNNLVAQDFINFKVEERCGKLAAVILRELGAEHNDQSKTKRNVSWLTRLGFEDRAREVYLAARSEMIHKRSRQCIFQGDLHLYIWQVSFVYFMIIHNTVKCFQGCFPPPMMSTCVKWGKEQVEAFNMILARQLSSTKRGGEIWTQCMERAKEHAGILGEVGLDFVNLVGRDLEGPSTRPGENAGLGLVS